MNTTENKALTLPSDQERALARPSQGWITSLKLLQSGSKELKNNKDWNVGEFHFGDINLGKRTTIVYVSHRYLAQLWVDNKKILESFNPRSPIFQEIKNTEVKYPKSNKNAGDNFLIWLAEIGEFAIFDCGKTSTVTCADEILQYLKKPEDRPPLERDIPQTPIFTLFSQIDSFGPSLSSQAPHVKGIDPATVESENIAQPSKEEMDKAIKMFQTPVENEQELEPVA